jgi:ABC-2 type transport system ATP-binding protein
LFRERIGVVLQELAVEPFFSVRQALTRNAGFYPCPRPVDEVHELIGLEGKANARVKTLSGGQQRRLDLGLGIVGNPELLVLDEPTTGFDPSARRGAWDLVRSMTGGGPTVILTTHYMDEAQALADRVAVVNAGRIVAEGTPDSLGGRDVGEATIRFRLPPAMAVTDLPVPATVSETGAVEIRTDKEIEALARLTTWALRDGVELIGLTVERLTLEDVYLRLTGYSSEAETAAAGPGA